MGNWMSGPQPRKKPTLSVKIPRNPLSQAFYEINPNDPGVEEGDHSVEAAQRYGIPCHLRPRRTSLITILRYIWKH